MNLAVVKYNKILNEKKQFKDSIIAVQDNIIAMVIKSKTTNAKNKTNEE